jgi:molybdopterin synthase catalytic subunit
VIEVRVFCFGVLKDLFGAALTVELPEGASVADLVDQLRATHMDGSRLRGIAVSVNSEYAEASRILGDDDEVGLLPPVSGGTDEPAPTPEQAVHVALTRHPIDAETLIAAAKRGEDGAVVVFDGVVRNHTRGRRTWYLDYESYEGMAAKQMQQLAAEARTRFEVRQVTMIHRLGRLAVGETSVLIIVASAHRGAAFDACRWLIDTLKKTVPIWKRETFEDGVAWADGEPFPAGLADWPEPSPKASPKASHDA